MDAVKETINTPDSVYKSEDSDNRKVFFKKTTNATYGTKFSTKVIVEYSQPDEGEVVTTFPTKAEKGGGELEMLNIKSKIDYDNKFDVLYYNISNTENSYGDEIDNTIIILRDMIDEEIITGITILDYKKALLIAMQKKKCYQSILIFLQL